MAECTPSGGLAPFGGDCTALKGELGYIFFSQSAFTDTLANIALEATWDANVIKDEPNRVHYAKASLSEIAPDEAVNETLIGGVENQIGLNAGGFSVKLINPSSHVIRNLEAWKNAGSAVYFVAGYSLGYVEGRTDSTVTNFIPKRGKISGLLERGTADASTFYMLTLTSLDAQGDLDNFQYVKFESGFNPFFDIAELKVGVLAGTVGSTSVIPITLTSMDSGQGIVVADSDLTAFVGDFVLDGETITSVTKGANDGDYNLNGTFGTGSPVLTMLSPENASVITDYEFAQSVTITVS